MKFRFFRNAPAPGPDRAKRYKTSGQISVKVNFRQLTTGRAPKIQPDAPKPCAKAIIPSKSSNQQPSHMFISRDYLL